MVNRFIMIARMMLDQNQHCQNHENNIDQQWPPGRVWLEKIIMLKMQSRFIGFLLWKIPAIYQDLPFEIDGFELRHDGKWWWQAWSLMVNWFKLVNSPWFTINLSTINCFTIDVNDWSFGHASPWLLTWSMWRAPEVPEHPKCWKSWPRGAMMACWAWWWFQAGWVMIDGFMIDDGDGSSKLTDGDSLLVMIHQLIIMVDDSLKVATKIHNELENLWISSDCHPTQMGALRFMFLLPLEKNGST